MEDLAAMDIIEDVFKVRMDVFETKDEDALKFAFGTSIGKKLTKKQLGLE